MYNTTYLNETYQATVQQNGGREGRTEEAACGSEQSPVQIIQFEKIIQSERDHRRRRSRVRPEAQAKGSTYFLPPFFLSPCCFDLAAEPPALALPLPLDLESAVAWTFLAFFFPEVVVLPFFPFSFFFPTCFFPPCFDESCQKGFQKRSGQRKVTTTNTQETVEVVTYPLARKLDLLGKIGYHLLELRHIITRRL